MSLEITILENKYVFDDTYRCDTALFLLSILSQSYNITIDRGISEPGHSREFVEGLNSTDKRFIFHLMKNVQLPGSKQFDIQMELHTSTQNNDVTLAQEFQKHLSKNHANMVLYIM